MSGSLWEPIARDFALYKTFDLNEKQKFVQHLAPFLKSEMN